MAKIEDLIAQIPDERLRKGIAAEVKALKKTKKFGLVFEEHLPETVRLPKLPVKEGELVAKKRESGNELWRVKSIRKGIATLERAVEGYPLPAETGIEVPVGELVVVRSFGDPIYPALVPVDRVARGGPDKPWHMLINADNFHALQLLLYAYEGKVDVIYIDPPYNTGARDWKYNNDYVDKSDSFRHSKWLSMMKKRLLLTKRLLSVDGILIVAIDDDEMPHLCVLLRSMFSTCTVQPIVIRHHPQGSGGDNISITHEYAIVVIPNGQNTFRGSIITAESEFWPAMKTGAGRDYFREGRPSMFYAVHVDSVSGKVTGVGPELSVNDKYPTGKTSEGWLRIYPFDQQKRERRWRCGRTKMLEYVSNGLVEFSASSSGIKLKKQRAGNTSPTFSIWDSPTYNAGPHGTTMLGTVLGPVNTNRLHGVGEACMRGEWN